MAPSSTTTTATTTNGTNGASHSAAIKAERAKSSLTFKELVAPGLSVEVELRGILASVQSPYQKVEVLDTYFGKTLVTDGKTQSTQFDEFAYHESLVHPPLLKAAALAGSDSAIKRVFIGGGGELATAREVLRHPSVERVVMVDIDEAVVELCRKHLPEWGGDEVATNPRFELIIGDAYTYLMETTEEKFDAIIMDISDPIEAGPGIMLYSKELYEHAKTILNPRHGVFCTQAGMAESVPADIDSVAKADPSCYAPVYNTLNAVFDCVLPYSSNIPSFGGDWGFIMAFTNSEAASTIVEWSRVPQKGMIDGLIEQHITGGSNALQWYDEMTHFTMFNLAKPLRKYMANDKRVMTQDNPIFMF